MNRSELKRKAKESLKVNGNYGESIKLLLLYILVCIILTIIVSILSSFITNEFLSIILALIIAGTIIGLYPGYYSFFLKVSRNEEVTCKELFHHKNLFWITIGVTLLACILATLGMFLFIIPGIIIALNYSMAYFVMIDYPELSITEILKKSKEMMKGHRIEYIILNLSFLGWQILNYFTFDILMLWLGPYMMVTTANFYNKIKEEV